MFPVAHRLNYVSTPSDLPEPLKMEGRRCPQRSEPAVLTKFVPPPGPHYSKGVLHGLPASPIFRFESSDMRRRLERRSRVVGSTERSSSRLPIRGLAISTFLRGVPTPRASSSPPGAGAAPRVSPRRSSPPARAG